MKIRLNKLISDYGICTRREADLFIREGRVTVNGKHPEIGDTVTENDIILVDDAQISLKDLRGIGAGQNSGRKAANLIFGEKYQAMPSQKKSRAGRRPSGSGDESAPTGAPLRERYGRYNKYAAARKAAKSSGETGVPENRKTGEIPAAQTFQDVVRNASVPDFGKSMKKGAIAQRIAAAAKSASLRKSSKNNPENKVRRSTRSGRKGK